MSRTEAKSLAWWLGEVYAPVSPIRPTRAPEHAAFFARAAKRRRRSEEFVMLMDRSVADLFARMLRSWRLVGETAGERHWIEVPGNIRAIGIRFVDALRPVGRKSLSRLEIEERATGKRQVEARHRKRVCRVLRYEQAKERFDAEGKTFLGSGLGEWPKF